MMKILIAFFFACSAFAATPSVVYQHMDGLKIGSKSYPDPSAILEADSTAQGIIIPRMTTTQRLAIGSPANGLLVYDTTLATVVEYNTTLSAWTFLVASSGGSVLNPSIAVITDSSGNLTSSPVTSTELGYVHNVTSSIQTQLNGKQATLQLNNVTEATSDVLNITNGSDVIVGNSAMTLQVKKATTSQDGYLGSADWATFNSKLSAFSGLTQYGATYANTTTTFATTGQGTSGYILIANGAAAPTFSQVNLSSSAGITGKGTATESTSDVLTLSSWSNATIGSPTIQVKKATTSQDGYLASSDWATFNGKLSAFSGLTQYGVAYATSTTTFGTTAAGSAGNVLTSNGTSAPTFQAAGASPTNNYYQGYHAQADSWTTTSTSYADPSNSGGATLTKRQGNITVATAGSTLPGITFTPAASTSVYLVCFSVSVYSSGANGVIGVQLTDGSTTIVQSSEVQQDGIGGRNMSISSCGVYVPGTGSAVTIKIQMVTSTGTATIGYGLYANPIEWTLIQIK